MGTSDLPVSQVSTPPRRLGTFRALRHPNYQLYFLGQLFSLTGFWVQTTAMTWLAYELTRQSRLPALISAAQILPMLLFSVWGGSLADRWPRRPLVFLTQSVLLLLALVLFGMVASGVATPLGLVLISLFIGVVNAIDTPARLVFVCDLVGKPDLMNAVALNSLVFNVARAIGPALCAELLPYIGLAGCFLFNGLTFAAILAALVLMRLPARSPDAIGHVPSPSLFAGFAHLRHRPGQVLLLALAGTMAFFGWPLLALLPAVADRQLGADQAAYARMVSAIGAGALLGALVVATFAVHARRTLLIGIGVAFGAASLAGLSLSRDLFPAIACCVGAGFGLILFFATGQATMQLGADEHNRGRVMGIWLMVLAGSQPAGNYLAGIVADEHGVTTALRLNAMGIALSAGVLLLAWLLLARGRR